MQFACDVREPLIKKLPRTSESQRSYLGLCLYSASYYLYIDELFKLSELQFTHVKARNTIKSLQSGCERMMYTKAMKNSNKQHKLWNQTVETWLCDFFAM